MHTNICTCSVKNVRMVIFLLEVSPEQLPVVTCIVLGFCSHGLVQVGLNVPFVGNRTDVNVKGHVAVVNGHV